MEQIISFDPVKNPLVSVICLCYNQARFVKESLDSVTNLSYDEVELIIVDDGSSDGSKAAIREWLNLNPNFQFVDLQKNLGSTAAFNQGLALAKGKYIIDLAADDILLPERITKQVEFFESQSEAVGVIYSDAMYMDESGILLHRHFDNPRLTPYEGDVYHRVIDTYFIPTPTMMMRKDVLDELGGYDENLAYEDFDFWVRSARQWEYAYQPEVLTSIRLVSGSHSDNYYQRNDRKLGSTVAVCWKIKELNRTPSEDIALIERLKYEIRHSFLAGKKSEMNDLYKVWNTVAPVSTSYLLIKYVGQLGLNLDFLRKPIQKLLGS